ncbi:acyltransferase [uncultured Ferrimonas sp.]|uniref:acyltransferase n=1 Tax=uncultured Ferrimonas sp. TaxID=432640 RepID=UPI00261C4A28|nr:acyltransferase [uncultured Ferrimonas sp.]
MQIAIKAWLRPHYHQLRQWHAPPLQLIYRPLLWLLQGSRQGLALLARTLLWTPLWRSQIEGGDGLYLYSGLPQKLGPVAITMGSGCRMSGVSTICGRANSRLSVGNNVDIGWQNSIAVGTQIVIEDNVRLAPKVLLAGYPGHPLNAEARAQGLPELPQQARPIRLQRDVWLGTGVIVVAGVDIGAGTVVAAGSVVTKSMPAHALVGGNPARVIRMLETPQ